MTVTRETLRQILSRYIGDWHTASTTSAGATDGTTTKDSALAVYGDDYYNDWYVVLPDGPAGTGSYECKRVTDFTSTTGTLTTGAFSAQVASGVSYELHRFDPSDKHDALNEARRLVFPHVYKPIRDESLIVDNLLANSGFEDTVVTGAHPSWTNVGSPTVSGEATIVRHGSQSAKMIAAAGAAGQMTQTPSINITELKGRTVTGKFHVYATAASKARVRLDWDGTTIVSSDYHGGNYEWEWLDVDGTVPDSATNPVKVLLKAAISATAYFDKGWLIVSGIPIYKYTIPSSLIYGPCTVEMQAIEDNPTGDYILLSSYVTPIAGSTLRLIGMGLLSEVTSDTGTMEINDMQAALVVTYAAEHFWETVLASSTIQEAGRYEGLADRARARRGELLMTPGVRMPRLPVQVSSAWGIEEDATGRYLVLRHYRG